MPAPDSQRDSGRSRFRATLVRVLIVQAVALALLGLIQVVYGP
jgi:hypothetical protein